MSGEERRRGWGEQHQPWSSSRFRRRERGGVQDRVEGGRLLEVVEDDVQREREEVESVQAVLCIREDDNGSSGSLNRKEVSSGEGIGVWAGKERRGEEKGVRGGEEEEKKKKKWCPGKVAGASVTNKVRSKGKAR